MAGTLRLKRAFVRVAEDIAEIRNSFGQWIAYFQSSDEILAKRVDALEKKLETLEFEIKMLRL